MALDKCPRCGFDDVAEKYIEKILRGPEDAAVVTVLANVCHHCGEYTFSIDAIRRFEQIRKKLASQQLDDFLPIGRYFRVPADFVDGEKAEKVSFLTELSDP